MNQSPSSPRPKRRCWYQFSLRTLIVLTVVVSVLLGLFAAWLRRAKSQAAAVAVIRENGGNVDYDYMWRRESDGQLSRNWTSKSAIPEWLLDRLGEDFFHDVLKARIEFNHSESQAERDKVLQAVGNLQKLEELEFFDLGFDGAPNVTPLRNLRKLRKLDLKLGRLESRDFEVLVSMTKLERLECDNQRIDDEVARHMQKLTNLLDLSIGHGNEVTDEAVARLATLPQLESLNLSGTDITDAALVEVAKIKTLKSLWVWETAVTDCGLASLSDLPHLEDLALSRTKVSGERVRWPAALMTVRAWDSPVTDDGVQSLCRCRRLVNLELAKTQISDAGVRHLSELANLKWLELDQTAITDAGLAEIGKLSKLEHLSLNMTRVTDAGIAKLEGLQELERLELGWTGVTCNQFNWPPSLTTVNVSHTGLTDEGLMRLAASPHLKYVLFDHSQVTGEGHARFCKVCPNAYSSELPMDFILRP